MATGNRHFALVRFFGHSLMARHVDPRRTRHPSRPTGDRAHSNDRPRNRRHPRCRRSALWPGDVPNRAALICRLRAARHGGFSVSGILLRGLAAVRFAFLYFLGFIAVAIFEEFSFRGYLQSTLQLAAGFWPAAVILAVVFGALHLGNRGEAAFGAVMAGCFGLLAAFTLRRTGTIWFAIGVHALWDWGETYFYSVRDSGTAATGSLLRSDFHGPTWLTGGSVGPEGSAIVFIVLAIAALGIHFLLPARKQAP